MKPFSRPLLSPVCLALCLSLSPALAEDKPAQDAYRIGERLTAPAPPAGQPPAPVREISWDDLIPADWAPERFLDELKLDELEDNDPRAMEVLAKIRAEWDNAPVNHRLNGQHIRIPGFVVVLDGERTAVREFLLVPYFGACVHVPPPPLNQLIHVLPDTPIQATLSMKPVWVEGVLTAQRTDTTLGNAGYQLRALRVRPYEEPKPSPRTPAPAR